MVPVAVQRFHDMAPTRRPATSARNKQTLCFGNNANRTPNYTKPYIQVLLPLILLICRVGECAGVCFLPAKLYSFFFFIFGFGTEKQLMRVHEQLNATSTKPKVNCGVLSSMYFHHILYLTENGTNSGDFSIISFDISIRLRIIINSMHSHSTL